MELGEWPRRPDSSSRPPQPHPSPRSCVNWTGWSPLPPASALLVPSSLLSPISTLLLLMQTKDLLLFTTALPLLNRRRKGVHRANPWPQPHTSQPWSYDTLVPDTKLWVRMYCIRNSQLSELKHIGLWVAKRLPLQEENTSLKLSGP